MRFLARAQPTTRFIGQDIDFALTELGPYTYFGSMDFGEAVAQWRQDGVMLELWFKQERCVSAEVS